MATVVDTNTTDARALATGSITRTKNGSDLHNDGTVVHIGGGVYLSAGHVFYQFVNPDNVRTAEAYTFNVAEGLAAPGSAVVDSSEFGDVFHNPSWGSEDGTDASFAVTDTPLGAAQPMVVYMDPNEASGTLTSFGYPVAGGFDGETMVEVAGTLSTNAHTTVPTSNGDFTVLISDIGMQVFSGQSGSGMWLTNDVDGDGIEETYLAGIVTLDVQFVGDLHAVGFEPIGDIYAELAAAIDAGGKSADDFARMTLVSGQTIGSSLTTVEGTSLHEDLIGGVNADTLNGAGGDDDLIGAEGADVLDGGDGRDTLDGGSGDDSLTDGAGVDQLTGGSGADIFVMTLDGNSDIIRDFELGVDKIDVSLWGANAIGDLAFTDHASGRVIIRFGAEAIVVDDGARGLASTDFDANQFIFATGSGVTTVTGTDDSEKIFGTAFDEEFHDGAGVDHLFGGGGTDTFVMAADGTTDTIRDFGLAEDRIDVSAWGATGFDELEITAHSAGRVIVRHDGEALVITGEDGPLAVEDFTAGHFLFA